jgi:hypothetical protein|tara:strand:+ start:717 stop:1427 length:711 start_codon:yes stop_codon:yes gene_type:complete
MALPKLQSQVYELEQPSTGEKIKYRPFLVKEQKTLMLASESEDETQIRDALAGIVSSCTFEKINPYSVPMFDVEFLFLRIRGKSVGEKIELNLLCPDDGETRVKTTLNLEDVGVNQKLGHSSEISITDKIKIIMNYPTLNDMVGMSGEKEAGFDEVLGMMKRCIHEVHDGEIVHSKIDMSESDLDEFIESLTTEQFQGLADFFDTMPKVAHSIEVTNPKTKKKGEVVIEGIQSFFD